VRWFFEMLRTDLDDVDVPPLPQGLEIRPIANEEADLRRLLAADVEAFKDHWGGFAGDEAFGRSRGWLDSVFTRRPWRRRGLGAAHVARSLVRLREAGMTEAMLGVDSDNPTGALGLYERAGFRVHTRSVAYRKPM
jgi:ribosomal protein S18 acetylase RimI-like enzyme